MFLRPGTGALREVHPVVGDWMCRTANEWSADLQRRSGEQFSCSWAGTMQFEQETTEGTENKDGATLKAISTFTER